MPELKIDDSGERTQYSTGALRENVPMKGMPELIPPEAMFRIARWYEMGAEKYADRNWEKGLPISRCIGGMLRHAYKYLAGCDDEDHLAAVCWNAMAIMFYEANLPGMQDLPPWKDRITKWIYQLKKD